MMVYGGMGQGLPAAACRRMSGPAGACLHLHHALLNGAARDVAVHVDGVDLPQAVHAVLAAGREGRGGGHKGQRAPCQSAMTSQRSGPAHPRTHACIKQAPPLSSQIVWRSPHTTGGEPDKSFQHERICSTSTVFPGCRCRREAPFPRSHRESLSPHRVP